MSRLRTLRDRRGQLVQQIRELANQAGENALTPEQRANYDKLFADQTSVAEEIRREEQLADAERELVTTEFRGGRGANGNGERPEQRTTEGLTDEELRAVDAELDLADDGVAAVASTQARRAAAPSRVHKQMSALLRDQRAHPRSAIAYRAAYAQFLRGGMASVGPDGVRALQAGTGAEGGYLATPMQTAAGIIIALNNLVWLRQLATTYAVPTAAALGVVSLDTDPADADWTSELATGSEDSSMAFGKRQLTPHPMAKRVKVSEKLMRMASGAEQIVQDRIAYKCSITEEKGFIVGSGAGQPLGVFTASVDGVPTSRDFTCGTTTAITSAGLITMKYALRAPYRRKAQWLFHRDGIKQIALLTDTTNVPIWLPSLREGQPDTLLGHPVAESEYAPNTFTTGLYVGMFADFSNYVIADALDIRIVRLNELYAETGQVGFIARKETDGQPALAEGFVRGKLA
jgi:HK97 family phage major capsid protein